MVEWFSFQLSYTTFLERSHPGFSLRCVGPLTCTFGVFCWCWCHLEICGGSGMTTVTVWVCAMFWRHAQISRCFFPPIIMLVLVWAKGRKVSVVPLQLALAMSTTYQPDWILNQSKETTACQTNGTNCMEEPADWPCQWFAARSYVSYTLWRNAPSSDPEWV